MIITIHYPVTYLTPKRNAEQFTNALTRAEAELSDALNNGYSIIHKRPYEEAVGHGTCFILYRPDKKAEGIS